MGTFTEAARQRAEQLSGRDELAGLTLVIEQHVESAAGDETYHLIFNDGTLQVIDGQATNPDVVIRQDHKTAEALRDGSAHAQTAFLTGQLRISGDVDKLVSARDALVALVHSTDPLDSDA